MAHFDCFMEMFGQYPLTLSMVRSIVDVFGWSHDELKTAMPTQDGIKKSWYQVAVHYTNTKHNTLRKRCAAENAMRLSWYKFQLIRVREMPEVPPLP